jgi:ankyrin repeat protein
LCDAIRRGNIDELRRILDDGVIRRIVRGPEDEVGALDAPVPILLNDWCPACRGWPPILIAASREHETAARLLIEYGASLDLPLDTEYVDWRGPLFNHANPHYDQAWHMTPLEIAAGRYGSPIEVRTLIAVGADPNAPSLNGRTLLSLAAYAGKPDIARELIAGGADVNAKDPLGLTPLHYAVIGSNVHIGGGYTRRDYDEFDIRAKEVNSWAPVGLRADRHGQDQVAVLLLQNGADIDTTGMWGQTPLGLAVLRKNLPFVKLLLERGADPNTRAVSIARHPGQGWSPLNRAICHHYDDIRELLLAHGAEMDVFDAIRLGEDDTVRRMLAEDPFLIHAREGEYFCTPLIAAIGWDRPELTEDLVSAGSDVNSRMRFNYTPLHVAVNRGSVDLAAVLLAQGADTEAEARINSVTPLMRAIQLENMEMARLLIAAGADPGRPNRLGFTPLHAAAEMEDLPAIEMLLAAGVDPSPICMISNSSWFLLEGKMPPQDMFQEEQARRHDPDATTGWTPLHYAVTRNNQEAVTALLAAGADPRIVDLDGNTLLHVAADRADPGLFYLFLDQSIDIQAVNDEGRSALMLAVIQGSYAKVAGLLHYGADATERDGQGRTLLHMFSLRKDPRVASVLLAAGAEVDARDESDRTPLHVAALNQNCDVARALLHAGADVDAVDSDGRTPLYYAMRRVDRMTIAVLLANGATPIAAP